MFFGQIHTIGFLVYGLHNYKYLNNFHFWIMFCKLICIGLSYKKQHIVRKLASLVAVCCVRSCFQKVTIFLNQSQNDHDVLPILNTQGVRAFLFDSGSVRLPLPTN